MSKITAYQCDFCGVVEPARYDMSFAYLPKGWTAVGNENSAHMCKKCSKKVGKLLKGNKEE